MKEKQIKIKPKKKLVQRKRTFHFIDFEKRKKKKRNSILTKMSKLRKALIAALILTFGYFAYMTVSGTSFGGGSYSGAEPRKVFGSRIATMVATKDSVMTIVETGIPVVATEEIAAILPATDPLYKRRYSKCAVVGNSAILLHQGRGEEIDKHDMVMRFNWPKLGDKYGPDYGLKTDIMVSLMERKKNRRLWVLCSFLTFSWLEHRFRYTIALYRAVTTTFHATLL